MLNIFITIDIEIFYFMKKHTGKSSVRLKETLQLQFDIMSFEITSAHLKPFELLQSV